MFLLLDTQKNIDKLFLLGNWLVTYFTWLMILYIGSPGAPSRELLQWKGVQEGEEKI